MNKLHKLAIVAILVIAIGGAYSFPKVQEAIREVGAVVGPDLISPYFAVNGVKHEYRKTKLTTATTTPCAVRSPSATSTLVRTSLQIQTATSTATTWTVAKATTGFATTTALRNTISLGSGAQGTMVHIASTTLVAIDSVDVFGPNEYLVWGVAGTAISDATKLNGVCQAEFVVNS